MSKTISSLSIVLLLFLALMLNGNTQRAVAQGDTIEFPGEITAVDGTIITVGGITVDVANAILPGDGLLVGMTVQVIGTAQGQTIAATIVVITDMGTAATPVPPESDDTEATEEPESEPEVTPVITTDTVNGIPIIVIEGPVQAINVSSITIFDIDIHVDPANVILTKIRIGDTVRVEGESSFEGNTVIIVAVNITIIQTTIVVINNPSPGVVVYIPSLPPSCKRSKKGNVSCKRS